MPYDVNGNYVDDCPACSSGGNMCKGMEDQVEERDGICFYKKKPLPDNDAIISGMKASVDRMAPDAVDHVSEIVELRALVSRLKQRMRSMEPWVVGNDAHGAIKTGLADNGNLTYEIH